jgi:hypothetical protein
VVVRATTHNWLCTFAHNELCENKNPRQITQMTCHVTESRKFSRSRDPPGGIECEAAANIDWVP